MNNGVSPTTQKRHGPRQFYRIGCWCDRSSGYGWEIAQGVADYGQSKPRWSVLIIPDDASPWTDVAPAGHWDGLVVQNSSPDVAAWARQHGIPTVNVSAKMHCWLPTVVVDNRAAGRLAAESVLAAGVKHFAVIGLGGGKLHFADLRLAGFQDRLRIAGQSCTVMTGLSRAHDWLIAHEESLAMDWLRALPKPVGLFLTSHVLTPAVVHLCRLGRMSIPEDVRIVVADSDAGLRTQLHPGITSVELNGRQVGLTAAGLLERLMAGAAAPAEPVLVPPGRLLEAAPSRASVGLHEYLCKAEAYMRQHCQRDLYMREVAEHVGISYRRLQEGFVQHRGQTLAAALNEARVERAKQLLRETDWTTNLIAAECGFQRREYFSRVFHRLTQQTPGQYRRAHAWSLRRTTTLAGSAKVGASVEGGVVTRIRSIPQP